MTSTASTVSTALEESGRRPYRSRGAPLPPFRPSFSLQRTRFAIELRDASTATVDVDHLSGQASLYRDDTHVRTSDMPAWFPLGADSIEVAASRYGMQRIHLVRVDGSQRRLDPAPGTPEHWRAQLPVGTPGSVARWPSAQSSC